MADRTDQLSGGIRGCEQAAEVGITVEINHWTMSAGQHHRFVVGDVELLKLARCPEAPQRFRRVLDVARAVRTGDFRVGTVGIQRLRHPARGGEIDGKTGFDEALVRCSEFLCPVAGRVQGTIGALPGTGGGHDDHDFAHEFNPLLTNYDNSSLPSNERVQGLISRPVRPRSPRPSSRRSSRLAAKSGRMGSVAALNRELADFLRRARAQVDPSRAGLPPDERVRRVPGLRREEVARLAGVSADYYARLEQGRPITPSPAVVDAIGRALELDAAGRAYLEDLIGPSSTSTRRQARGVQRVRPGLYQLLDALDGEPALVLGRRTDILAANRMAKALFADFDQMPAPRRNYARWMLLDPDARSLFVDWPDQARAAVESLRFEVGRDPEDRGVAELIAELREHSPEFGEWWAQHRVHQRTHGSKRLHHPLVGELTVEYESLNPPGDPDTTLYVYTTEPGSSSRKAINLLASWTAPTPESDPHSTR